MITGKRTLLLLFVYFLIQDVHGQSRKKMERLIRDNFKLAALQYQLLSKNTPADSMPRNFNTSTDRLVNSNLTWWTSGFFPASLWLIYDYTGDTTIRRE